MSVAFSEVGGKVKGKYFQSKHRPARILLYVNAMTCFILKLQLKFKNKKLLFCSCKFPSVLR
jgi:hypothetical protein